MIGDGRETYSYNTLMSMKKVQLINAIRLLENNLISANARIEQQYQNTKEWQPVRHGRWIKNKDDYYSLTVYQCSECKEEWCFEVGEDIHDLNYNYCPNCGAKMDEE